MFITTNLQDRDWGLFGDDVYAREAIEVLYSVKNMTIFFLYSFVIMPDHCHFLLKVPKPGSVSKIMNRFKMGVSHSIGLGPIWQSRFHVVLPENPHSVIHYIHQNPVKAGLVKKAKDYPWSSGSGKWKVDELG